MKRNDTQAELYHAVSLLNLRPRECVIDVKTEPDKLLPIMNFFVTEHGRTVGASFGKASLQATRSMLDEESLDHVETVAAHAYSLPFRDGQFHAAMIRDTHGLTSPKQAIAEAHRIVRDAGRVLARHTQWEIDTPRMTDEDREMIAALTHPAYTDGLQFLRDFAAPTNRWWSHLHFDCYCVTNRDVRDKNRHNYDWRTMLRDQLLKHPGFESKQIIEFISRLERTRGSKVRAERWMAVGVVR